MNCIEANKMSIAGFLQSQGIKPVKHTRKGPMFHSPLRNDSDASFIVYDSNNYWHDFGTGEHGTLIDLVRLMFHVDVSAAIKIIADAVPVTRSFSFGQPIPSNNPSIQICHTQPIQNQALVQYLESRRIPASIAKKYVTEVYYKTYQSQVKAFFALGFKNDKGGFELRSGFKSEKFPNGFKGSTSPKTITTIDGNPRNINIFEGFIDFLSALVFFGIQEPANETIVLNSLSHLRLLYEIIPQHAQVNLYLDNDTAGEKAASEILAKYPGAINRAKIIYPEFKDFNQFICNTLNP